MTSRGSSPPSPAVLALALAALPLGGCLAKAAPRDPAPFVVDGDVVAFRDTAAESAALELAPLSRAADDHLGLTGRLVWDDDVTARVFSPVAGRVVRILRDFGTRVARGERLVELSSPDFGQAQSEAARAEADLRVAERSLERVSEVFEHGGASRKDRDAAEADLQRARAESERTSLRVRQWGGRASGPVDVDQDIALRSPVAGVVVERNLNPGQEVRPDATTPLFVVSDPSRLWILLDATEGDLASLEPGARLRIGSAAFPGRSFDGVLDTLGASLDPATRTVKARGKVANPDGLLRAEMYVSVLAQRRAAAVRLMAPARAVLHEGTEDYVFVAAGDHRFRRTSVRPGIEREGAVPIVSGVGEGARIVVEGQLLLEAAWAGAHGR
jgi:membrane fusion protein, heavy metal efflux system